MNTLGKIYYGMHRVSNLLCKLLCALTVMVVILNAGTVLLQVINRYVIVKISDYSVSWTEELARYSMIWLCYLALPLCYREGSMAQLDLIFDRLGKRGKISFYLLTRVLIVVFLAVAIYYGCYIVETRMVYKSSLLRAPGYLLYSAPVFGCVVTGYEVLTELVGVCAGVLSPFYAGEKRNFPEHSEPEDILRKGDDA